jgi:thiamine pyrophosphokinase
MPRILIFANGALPDPEAARRLLRPDDVVFAADGGTRHVLALGRMPSVIIGDLDSLDRTDRGQVEAAGVQIIRFPHDKNETDLELALRHAAGLHPESILLVGVLGRRLDQTLGNLALMADPELAAFDVRADDGIEEAFFCRAQAEVRGVAGEVVSLVPWGGDVKGVRTQGLKWPLRDETLYFHKTRGISNELKGERASVRISSGLLLIVHRRVPS